MGVFPILSPGTPTEHPSLAEQVGLSGRKVPWTTWAAAAVALTGGQLGCTTTAQSPGYVFSARFASLSKALKDA